MSDSWSRLSLFPEDVLSGRGALRTRESEYEDAVLVVDTEMRLHGMNRSAELMYGLSMAAHGGMRMTELVQDESSRERLEDFYTAMLRAEHVPPFEARRTRPDGSVFHVLVSANHVIDEEDRVVGVVTRSRLIDDLVRERGRFQRLFEGSVAPMAIIDADTVTLDANEAHAALFHMNREDCIGGRAHDMVFSEDLRLAEELRSMLSSGEVPKPGFQMRFRTIDNKVVWAEFTVSVLRPTGTDSPEDRGAFLIQLRDVGAQRRYEENLRFFAEHDPLTGLLNRRAFDIAVDVHRDIVEEEHHGTGALLLVDLDNFKWHNDTFGHPSGDALLVAIADALKDLVGDLGSVGRLGGDEFAILVSGGTESAIRLFCEEVVRTVADTTRLAEPRAMHPVTATVGAALFEPGVDQAELYRRADVALYQVKTLTKNGVQLYS